LYDEISEQKIKIKVEKSNGKQKVEHTYKICMVSFTWVLKGNYW